MSEDSTCNVTVRLTGDERAKWTTKSSGGSLNAWVRGVCNLATRKTLSGLSKTPTTDDRLTIKITEDERAKWTGAAAKAGAKIGRPLTLSEWIRHVCNAASGTAAAA